MLIPAAGRGEYFAEALASVLAQSWTQFQVLVIDNRSPTNVYAEVVEEAGDPRVIYRREEIRLPMTDNWQRCLEQVSTRYFAFLHDDDVWEPTHLERAMESLTHRPEAKVALMPFCEFTGVRKGPISDATSNRDWKFLRGLKRNELRAAILLDDWAHMSALVFDGSRAAFDCDSYWMPDQIYFRQRVESDGLVLSAESTVWIRQHPLSLTSSTSRYVRVLERDLVTRRGLHRHRNDADMHAAIETVCSGNPEMAFRLFRGVCSWPLNVAVIRAYTEVLLSPRVLQSLATRICLAWPARALGIGWLVLLSLAMDCIYWGRATFSKQA